MTEQNPEQELKLYLDRIDDSLYHPIVEHLIRAEKDYAAQRIKIPDASEAVKQLAIRSIMALERQVLEQIVENPVFMFADWKRREQEGLKQPQRFGGNKYAPCEFMPRAVLIGYATAELSDIERAEFLKDYIGLRTETNSGISEDCMANITVEIEQEGSTQKKTCFGNLAFVNNNTAFLRAFERSCRFKYATGELDRVMKAVSESKEFKDAEKKGWDARVAYMKKSGYERAISIASFYGDLRNGYMPLFRQGTHNKSGPKAPINTTKSNDNPNLATFDEIHVISCALEGQPVYLKVTEIGNSRIRVLNPRQ